MRADVVIALGLSAALLLTPAGARLGQRAVASNPQREAVAAARARPMVGTVGRDAAREGDTLLSIAERNHLAIDHLCFANDWPSEATEIYAGTPVIVPGARVMPVSPPYDGIVVNLPERGLYLFREGRFVRFFPVSIGFSGECPTPLMRTHVTEKVKNPTWFPPPRFKGLGPVPPGPDNPLGARWIGLGVGAYGIHSTNRAVNIGLSTTGGCIRLYPSEICALYDLVRVGMSVRVEYETAKVGRRADGALFLVTFPDVYGRGDPVIASRRLVRALGLADRWTARVAREAALTRGLPIALSDPEASAGKAPRVPKVAPSPFASPVEGTPAPGGAPTP